MLCGSRDDSWQRACDVTCGRAQRDTVSTIEPPPGALRMELMMHENDCNLKQHQRFVCIVLQHRGTCECTRRSIRRQALRLIRRTNMTCSWCFLSICECVPSIGPRSIVQGRCDPSAVLAVCAWSHLARPFRCRTSFKSPSGVRRRPYVLCPVQPKLGLLQSHTTVFGTMACTRRLLYLMYPIDVSRCAGASWLALSCV